MTNHITPKTYFAGETIRFWVSDLTHLIDGPITAGADVTFVLADLAGNTLPGGGAGVPSNDDWYVDVTMPSQPGPYRMLMGAVFVATTGEAVWKGALPFSVAAHQ